MPSSYKDVLKKTIEPLMNPQREHQNNCQKVDIISTERKDDHATINGSSFSPLHRIGVNVH